MEPPEKLRRPRFAQRQSLAIPSRAEFERLANSKEVIDATDQMLSGLPVDLDFESFDDLRKLKDKYGVVRLKR